MTLTSKQITKANQIMNTELYKPKTTKIKPKNGWTKIMDRRYNEHKEQEHRIFIIKNRMVNTTGMLKGILTEDAKGKLVYFNLIQLVKYIDNNYDFIILSEDTRPAKLSYYNMNTLSDGFYIIFRTVGDATKKNNFSSIPRINEKTARVKARIYKE